MSFKQSAYLVGPTFFVFALPWWHRLVFMNMTWAWPDLSGTEGHVLSALLTLVVAFVAAMASVWD